ncbi:MAG: class I SAM-dependent methyltransferase [Patescibacteria group bacterium]
MQIINCNFCGSNKYKILFTNTDRLHKTDNQFFNIVKCSNCGLVYLNPQPSAMELVRYYPKQYGPYQNDNPVFYYSPISKILRKIWHFLKYIINKHNNKKNIVDTSVKNYLDFGCGSGHQLESVKKLHPFWNFYGLDVNHIACRQTIKKGFKVFCGDIATLNLPKNFFDIVNMNHVVEHLNNPKETLMQIKEILKINGCIIISTPNFDSWAAKIFKSYWYAIDTPRHLFLFTPKHLSLLLCEMNFNIKKITYDPGPKVAIKSFYYFWHKKDLRINPWIWKLCKPISYILSIFGKTSIMTILCEKNFVNQK